MPSSKTTLYWLPVVLAGVALIYLPGLDNPPIFDDKLLTDGTLFSTYGSLFQLKPRLFSYGSFVWLHDLFGAGWWKQRLANLLIHIGVVLALWGFYRELLRHVESSTGAPPPLWQSPALGLAIGFFALNPAAVYGTSYLIQRSILLATLFVVLALWSFARALAGGRGGGYALALLFYVLAVASKEHAIMAPLAAVPVYILVSRPTLRRLLLGGGIGAILVAAAGLLLALRYGEIIGQPFDEYSRIFLAQLSALGPDVEKNAFGLSLINQAYFFFGYGLHWLFPAAATMSIDMRPPFPVTWLSFPQLLGVFGYAGVVIGGLFLLIRYRDGRALLGLSLLLPALLFASEFLTVWVQDPFVLYRSYLWAIGVPGLIFFLAHGFPRWGLLLVGLSVALIFIWQALDRVVSLSTPERAWSDAIAKLPDDPRSVGRWFPYLNRGLIYVDENRQTEAIADFKASASLGDRGIGMHNIGVVLLQADQPRAALQALDGAERQGYDLFSLYYQRAQIYHRLEQWPLANRDYDAALAKNPPAPVRARILAAKGAMALQLHHPDEGVQWLERALSVDAGLDEARQSLGMAYVMQGDFARARELFNALLEKEGRGSVYYGRALANYGLKRKNEALSDIDNALRMGPDDPNLRAWRSKIAAMH